MLPRAGRSEGRAGALRGRPPAAAPESVSRSAALTAGIRLAAMLSSLTPRPASRTAALRVAGQLAADADPAAVRLRRPR